MLGKTNMQKDFFDSYVYENLLPCEHILLDIKEQIDFSFVEEELKDLYDNDNGRPSYPPEVLFKMLFLEFYYNLSDVEIAKQIRYNILYRYFVGLRIHDSTPDDTTLVVFRTRCGQERFERLFDRVVQLCKEKNLLRERLKIVDATAIDADVAIPNTVNLLRQGRRVIIKRLSKNNPQKQLELSKYQTKEHLQEKPKPKELKKEISKTKEFISQLRGKYGEETDELLNWLEALYNPKRDEAKIVSFIDTDARHGVKTPKRMFSGYKAHIALDENEIITSVDTLQGHQNEGSSLKSILEKEQTKDIKSEAVTADALYDSTDNRQEIHNQDMKAYIPSRKKSTKAEGFIYIKEQDKLICPKGQISTTKNRQEKGDFYNFSIASCRSCELFKQCAAICGKHSRIFISDNHKLKLQDDDEFYLEAIKLRKMVERKFGEAKKWHGLDRARYRGKWRVAIQVLMTFLILNVKRIVKLFKEKLKLPSLEAPFALGVG